MTRIVFCLTASLCFLFSCNNREERDINEVKKCFYSFKSAVIENNGAEAIKWIDKNTTKYYSDIYQYTLYGDSVEIRSLDLLEKFGVLRIRYKLSKNEILTTDGNSFFALLIERELFGGENDSSKFINEIVVNDNNAVGVIRDGFKEPMEINFYREKKQWKIDVVSLNVYYNNEWKSMIRNRGQTEDEFIDDVLKYWNINNVNIWSPLE